METRRVKVVQIEEHIDNRGQLSVISFSKHVPFAVKRIFFITGNGETRGGHAHKKCHQMLIMVHGVGMLMTRDIDTGNTYYAGMVDKNEAYYIPPGNSVAITLEPGAVLLVLASEEYDPDDYI